jgi:hypothetical protein
MMRTLLVLSVLLSVLAFTVSGVSAQHGGGTCDMPGTNLSFPCPEYNYTRVGRIELRHYYEVEVASFGATSRNIIHGIEDAFFPLFEYFNGSNSAGQKIQMSIPVVADISPRLTYHNIEEVLFLPPAYIGKAPKPNNANITVVDFTPRRRVAVHHWFAEGTDTERIFGEAEFLIGELNRQGIRHQNGSFAVAFYDAPEVRGEKLFEVWAFLL